MNANLTKTILLMLAAPAYTLIQVDLRKESVDAEPIDTSVLWIAVV